MLYFRFFEHREHRKLSKQHSQYEKLRKIMHFLNGPIRFVKLLNKTMFLKIVDTLTYSLSVVAPIFCPKFRKQYFQQFSNDGMI